MCTYSFLLQRLEDFTSSTKKLLEANLARHLSEFASLRNEINFVLKNVLISGKEHSEAVRASKASFETIRERTRGFISEKEDMDTRVLAEVSEKHEQVVREMTYHINGFGRSSIQFEKT